MVQYYNYSSQQIPDIIIGHIYSTEYDYEYPWKYLYSYIKNVWKSDKSWEPEKVWKFEKMKKI